MSLDITAATTAAGEHKPKIHMKKLTITELEAKVLLAIYEDARDGTGYDFAYTSGIRLKGVSPLAFASAVGSLGKKGLIELHTDTQQALAPGQGGRFGGTRKDAWDRLKVIAEEGSYELLEVLASSGPEFIVWPVGYTAPEGSNSPSKASAKSVIAAIETAIVAKSKKSEKKLKKASAAAPVDAPKGGKVNKAAAKAEPKPKAEKKAKEPSEKAPKAFRETKRGIICEVLMNGATNEEAAKIANANFPGKSIELTKGLVSGYRSDVEFFFRLFEQFGIVKANAKLPLA